MTPGFHDVIEAGKKLSPAQRIVLYGNCLQFIFGGLPHQSLSTNLARAGIDFDVFEYRVALQSNGQLLRDAKVWLYAHFCGVDIERTHSLSLRETNALKLALSYPGLTRRLRAIQRMGRPALSLKGFDKAVVKAIKAGDVIAHGKTVVYKKLTFLVNNYGQDKDDLYDDMESMAIVALYKAYPQWEDLGHLKALSKMTMTNRAMNIIDEQTTLKRQAMFTDEKGRAHALKQSYDVIGEMPAHVEGAGFTMHSYLSVGIKGDHSNHEAETSIKELLASRTLSNKRRSYLTLLLGTPDDEFSEYLGQCNAQAYDKMDFDVYRSKVEAYMGIPSSAGLAFLSSLRSAFGAKLNC